MIVHSWTQFLTRMWVNNILDPIENSEIQLNSDFIPKPFVLR